jgi:6-pyruvoyltetrahydropterin/6-carboxytetrahydropterin synthase
MRGQLDPMSQYVMNIKRIDEAAREFIHDALPTAREKGPSHFLWELVGAFEERWRRPFEAVELLLSPTLSCEIKMSDIQAEPTMRLSQKFEFSASHRLHNSGMTEEENRMTFGKCNNPRGHGHNYELKVTLKGRPNASGLLIDIPEFERIVSEAVIERFDHKNLNDEVPEFENGRVIPSVENISKVIFDLLKPKLTSDRAQLVSVTVWETPKTWCEYSE